MKIPKMNVIFLGALLTQTTLVSVPVNPKPGDSVWHLANQIEGCLETILQNNSVSHNALANSLFDTLCITESEIETFQPILNTILSTDQSIFDILCQIEQSLIDDFAGTFTMIETILEKLETADSKLDFLPDELNATFTQLIPVLDKSRIDLSLIDSLLTASADLLSTATLFESIEFDLVNATSLVEKVIGCDAIPIKTPVVISTPGKYCISNPIFGQITINSDDVSLDINGFTIHGGLNGILINPGFSNIRIHDGEINGSGISTNGVLINNATLVQITNVEIVNCTNGIQLINSQACAIINSVLSTNKSGIVLNNSHRNSIVSCTLFNNTTNGITLTNSRQNYLLKDIIKGIIGATNSSSYGILSTAGSTNYIIECLVQNINGNLGTIGNTTGGIILSSEKQTRIINCLVDKINGGSSGSQALGIAALPLADSITTGSCVIQKNTVSNTNSNGTGIGYQGSGTINIFINNEAQNNDINYGPGIPNVFNPQTQTFVGTLQNISL